MLRQVPSAIRRTSRQLVMNHPNSVDVIVMRKKVIRDASNPAETNVSGKKTLGGAMVLTPEEEADYQINLAGDDEEHSKGKMMFLQTLEGTEQGFDNAPLYQTSLVKAYIYPTIEDAFVVKKYDRIFWVMPGHVMQYQVAEVGTPTHIPPYVDYYILQPLEHITDTGEP